MAELRTPHLLLFSAYSMLSVWTAA